MVNIGELKAKFLRAYANLPEPERSQVVVIIGTKTYSWDAAYSEVSAGTELGTKILKKLSILQIL